MLRAWLLLKSRGIATTAETLAGAILEAERDQLTTVEADAQLRIWKAQAEHSRRQGTSRIRRRI